MFKPSREWFVNHEKISMIHTMVLNIEQKETFKSCNDHSIHGQNVFST